MATNTGVKKTSHQYTYNYGQLHILCCQGDLRKVKNYVENLDEKALLEKLTQKVGVFGYTPLHEAAAAGKADILEFLLSHAGTLNLVNLKSKVYGVTPLHIAASGGHEGCIRVLLRHNADISATDDSGNTPRYTAMSGSLYTSRQSAKISAKEKERAAALRLLRSAGQ